MEPAAAPDGLQLATAIFRLLIADRRTNKYKAVELLNASAQSVDLAALRTLLLRAITKDFYVGKENEQNDNAIAETRSWLLGMLARISAGEAQATKLVIRHVDKNFEPYEWARYWSLEGLISGNNSEVESVAKGVADIDGDSMVSTLAAAFLASKNDQKAAQKIRKLLDEPRSQWFALRALRIVPLPATVSAVCKIVETADYTDVTYDAIMALGKIPSDWSQATMAAQTLSTCIVMMRGSPWKDGMRTGAIAGLGNLKAESSGPLIIEELTDDNPAVVREAARSIEKILGLGVTVIRIIEAASKSGAAGIDAYARALRWLNREAVAEELGRLMITGPTRQQDVSRTLLSELGGEVAFEKLRARTDAMKQYTEVLEATEEKIRGLFEGSVREALKGFHLAVIMDVVVFTVGVVLLLGSAGYALFNTGNLANWAGVGLSGGIGVLGIVYGVLVANPRRQVRESVDHLMRVKIVFLAYLRRLHQTDQAYTRRLLDDEPITVDQVKGFADIVGDIMEDTVHQQLDNTDPTLQRAARTRQKDGHEVPTSTTSPRREKTRASSHKRSEREHEARSEQARTASSREHSVKHTAAPREVLGNHRRQT